MLRCQSIDSDMQDHCPEWYRSMSRKPIVARYIDCQCRGYIYSLAESKMAYSTPVAIHLPPGLPRSNLGRLGRLSGAVCVRGSFILSSRAPPDMQRCLHRSCVTQSEKTGDMNATRGGTISWSPTHREVGPETRYRGCPSSSTRAQTRGPTMLKREPCAREL